MRGHWRSALWWLAIVLLISGFVWFPFHKQTLRTDTYSAEAQGKKFLYLLCRDTMDSVRRNHTPLTSFLNHWKQTFDDSRVLCILGPAKTPTEEQWTEISGWVASGGRLVLAAPSSTPSTLAWLGVRFEEADIEDGAVSTPLLRSGDEKEVFWYSGFRLDLPATAEIIVSASGKPQVAHIRHGRGSVLVVADDDIFSNESMVDGDNKLLAMRMLEVGGPVREIVFDESLNREAVPKIVGLLFVPRVRFFTLALLLAILFLIWWKAFRFGPPLPAALTARRDLTDHTDTLGRLLFRGDDGKAALRAYWRRFLHDVGLRRVAKDPARMRLAIEPVAARLDRPVEEIEATLTQTRAALQAGHVPRAAAAALIRRLAIIRRLMTATR